MKVSRGWLLWVSFSLGLLLAPATAQQVVGTPAVGTQPYAVAVNPVTNQIYVANFGGNNVSVIDGATHTAIATPSVGTNPGAVAVNPVTNQIYVANLGGNTVSVIDGSTHAVIATPAVGSFPYAVAVNPVTNQIYVANNGGNNLSVIDGSTHTVIATPTVGTSPLAVAVNPLTNQIYVSNNSGNTVSVIDGSSHTVIATPAVGSFPWAVAVNPVTNRIYVANYGGGTVSVIDADASETVPLAASTTFITDALTVLDTEPYTTRNTTPSFTATVTSEYSSSSYYSSLSGITNPVPTALYYWVDDGSASVWTGVSPATTSSPTASFTITPAGQSTGFHTLYYFAAYGDEGEELGQSGSPEIGNLQAVSYMVLPATSTATLSADVNPQNTGSTVSFTALVTPGNERSGVEPSGVVYFYDGSTVLGSSSLAQSGSSYQAVYSTSALAAGTHAMAAVYSGDSNYASSSGSMTETIAGAAVNVTPVSGGGQNALVGTPFANPLVVLVADSNNIPVPGTTVNFSGAGLSFSPSAVATDANGKASTTATPTAAGSLSATASVSGVTSSAVFAETGVAPTLTISSISTMTLPQSGNGSASFTLGSAGGVRGTIALSCSGLPAGLTCSLSPSSVQATSLPANVTVSVTAATARTTADTRHRSLPPGWTLGLILPGLVLTGTCLNRKSGWAKAGLLSLLLLLLSLSGCGGSSKTTSTTGNSVVSPGTYSGTVTASASGISAVSANFTVVVTQ